jgi:hypothetical protein
MTEEPVVIGLLANASFNLWTPEIERGNFIGGLTTEDITRGVWNPDRLTEVDPDDALAAPLP